MNAIKSIVLLVLCLSAPNLFAAGDPAAGKEKSAACAGCHGADGNSVNPEWPKLAGQGEKYIYKQLNAFKEGKRQNPLMAGPVAALTDQDIQDLAAYFASRKTSPGSADPDSIALGRQVYNGGNLKREIPACMGCHGPAGDGNPAAAFPRLSFQHGTYVENQLVAYRDGVRKTDVVGIMPRIARRMSKEEIKAVSDYVTGLH